MSPSNHTPIDDLIKKHLEPKNPVSHSPEAGPIAESKVELLSVNETGEHEVNDEEVKKFVDINKENLEIDPELKKAGVQVVNSPPQYPPHLSYPLPVSDEKVIAGLKSPINTSIRWLAELSMFLLRQAHISLKNVHGKIIRVIRNN